MAFDIEQENARHTAGWKGFVLFTCLSTVAVILALVLMALFLL